MKKYPLKTISLLKWAGVRAFSGTVLVFQHTHNTGLRVCLAHICNDYGRTSRKHIIPCPMRCSLQCASHVGHTLSVPDSGSVPPVLFQTVLQNRTRMEHAKHHILSGAGYVDSVCDIRVLSIVFSIRRVVGQISFVAISFFAGVMPHLILLAVRLLLHLLFWRRIFARLLVVR